MATSSIGKLVIIDDNAADRMIAQIEEQEANPRPFKRRKIKWGDPKKLAEALSTEYADEK
ncbi:MAG: hypothetical protein FWD27_02755 [Coriobacteriia bacterium]|nr:hypothetical protein [Coriobacteriia bacterium]